MVFLGGCATGLLITDPAAPPIRVTRDVDAIVNILTRADYHQLAGQLRARGFSEDTTEDAPICRWLAANVVLDVMPIDGQILGFGNRWYAPAMHHSETISLQNGLQIRRVSAPYFLITKLEAFDGRGGGDYQMSHDIEDIVALLDGRPEIVDEIRYTDPVLASELARRFKTLLQDVRFVAAVTGHMPPDQVSQKRAPAILELLKDIAERDN